MLCFLFLGVAVWGFVGLQTGAMCPFQWHLWHSTSLNLQSFASLLLLPHLKQRVRDGLMTSFCIAVSGFEGVWAMISCFHPLSCLWVVSAQPSQVWSARWWVDVFGWVHCGDPRQLISDGLFQECTIFTVSCQCSKFSDLVCNGLIGCLNTLMEVKVFTDYYPFWLKIVFDDLD